MSSDTDSLLRCLRIDQNGSGRTSSSEPGSGWDHEWDKPVCGHRRRRGHSGSRADHLACQLGSPELSAHRPLASFDQFTARVGAKSLEEDCQDETVPRSGGRQERLSSEMVRGRPDLLAALQRNELRSAT